MNSGDVLLIINPHASKGQGKKKAKKLGSYFKKNHIQCMIAYTLGEGYAEKLAAAGVSNGFKCIVAAGGDGTVNEVLNGIMKSGNRDVKMGIIPIGRGNDFAWAAKIPTNIYKASDLIIKGLSRPCDVGVCRGDGQNEANYFLNGTGFGFEPMVNFRAMEYKHLNGFPSYVVAFLYCLKNPPKGYDVRLIADGRSSLIKTQQISVANGIRMGGGFKMTPFAKLDDGKFDVMFPNSVYTGLSLIKLALNFFKGGQVKDKVNFTYFNAEKVEIEVQSKDIPVHSDGEVFTYGGGRFSLELLPSALSLIY